MLRVQQGKQKRKLELISADHNPIQRRLFDADSDEHDPFAPSDGDRGQQHQHQEIVVISPERPSTPIELTNDIILRAFGNKLFQSGKQYFDADRVLSIKRTDKSGDYYTLRSSVEGGNPTPYQQEMLLRAGSIVKCKCNCPYATSHTGCKHCCAALLAYVARTSSPPSKRSSPATINDNNGWAAIGESTIMAEDNSDQGCGGVEATSSNPFKVQLDVEDNGHIKCTFLFPDDEDERQNKKQPAQHNRVIYVDTPPQQRKSQPQRRRQQAASETQPLVIHQGIQCDGCRGLVAGTRYKCKDCNDFDLCMKCFAKRNLFHCKTHLFLAIEKPVDDDSEILKTSRQNVITVTEQQQPQQAPLQPHQKRPRVEGPAKPPVAAPINKTTDKSHNNTAAFRHAPPRITTNTNNVGSTTTETSNNNVNRVLKFTSGINFDDEFGGLDFSDMAFEPPLVQQQQQQQQEQRSMIPNSATSSTVTGNAVLPAHEEEQQQEQEQQQQQQRQQQQHQLLQEAPQPVITFDDRDFADIDFEAIEEQYFVNAKKASSPTAPVAPVQHEHVQSDHHHGHQQQEGPIKERNGQFATNVETLNAPGPNHQHIQGDVTANDTELDKLRKEIDSLKHQFGAKIQQLQQEVELLRSGDTRTRTTSSFVYDEESDSDGKVIFNDEEDYHQYIHCGIEPERKSTRATTTSSSSSSRPRHRSLCKTMLQEASSSTFDLQDEDCFTEIEKRIHPLAKKPSPPATSPTASSSNNNATPSSSSSASSVTTPRQHKHRRSCRHQKEPIEEFTEAELSNRDKPLPITKQQQQQQQRTNNFFAVHGNQTMLNHNNSNKNLNPKDMYWVTISGKKVLMVNGHKANAAEYEAWYRSRRQ